MNHTRALSQDTLTFVTRQVPVIIASHLALIASAHGMLEWCDQFARGVKVDADVVERLTQQLRDSLSQQRETLRRARMSAARASGELRALDSILNADNKGIW